MSATCSPTDEIVPTNLQLYAAAMSGSEAAWAAIVHRYTRLIWKVVRGFRLDQATAEDVVQVTWARLVEHLHRIREPERIGGWLATTARNEALAAVRRNGRVVPVGAAHEMESMAVWLDVDAMVAEVDQEMVVRAFAALPAADQELLLLLTADPPLPYDQVAAALERPIGSIGPSRGRAIERLRRALDAEQLRCGIVAQAC